MENSDQKDPLLMMKKSGTIVANLWKLQHRDPPIDEHLSCRKYVCLSVYLFACLSFRPTVGHYRDLVSRNNQLQK